MIKIMLVDDHKVMRAGVRALLEQHDDLKVVAEADNGRDACSMIDDAPVDVVIMDVGMPGMNGIDATRQILCKSARSRVLALSALYDRRYIIAMLKAGASGYIMKGCDIEELLLAIRAVASNKKYLSPDIAGMVVDQLVHGEFDDETSQGAVLTARERETLQLLAEGNSVKQIALALHISVSTVETHRRHIMGKLGITSIAGLTRYAIREGITQLDN